MSNVDYFIGDLHIGDPRIIEWEDRPFINVEEMHKVMVEKWNSIVPKDGIVYILGDLTFTKKEETKRVLSKLKGNKILIKGHDDTMPNKWYHECGIDEVYNHNMMYGKYCLCSHEPEYINMHTPYRNIFAHVHNSPNFPTVTPRSFCVSAERLNYTPISFMSMMLKMMRMEKFSDKILKK